MLGARVSSSRPTTARTHAKTSLPAKRHASPKLATRPAISSTRRPLLLLMAIVVASGYLVSRLVLWQVIQHTRLATMATVQHNESLVVPSLRGQIYDASGDPLATDITLNLVYADPRLIKHPSREAALLAPILGLSATRITAVIEAGTTYAQLAPTISTAQTTAINRLGLPGIFLQPIIRRDYPEASTGAHILGYTSIDNGAGINGLEQYYNSVLTGTAGLSSVLHAAAGNSLRQSSAPASTAHNGGNLYLSLDGFVQNAVETELLKAVKLHRADGGTIIVTDPRTGFVLGMASTPTYDPNTYWKYASNQGVYQNPAISWTYEPGSTFKIVTMAAGLDAHVITPNTAFEDTGAWQVGDVTLHNWNMLGNGWETMTQVLQHSANVGASFVSSRLGAARFYKYVKRFGIGKPTGIDLSNEEAGILPLPGQKNWTIVNQYTNSFGQGLATTPMQMIRAVDTVANGGVMMKPQVVRQIIYDGHVVNHPPVSQGRVISAQSAHTLTDMLLHSAIDGEASLALIKGYNIAAKTGTANVASSLGGYLSNDTIASTVAYAPAFHPRFAAIVILNHPRDQPWGSMTAAPVIHDLFQDLFMYYHIPPSARALYQ